MEEILNPPRSVLPLMPKRLNRFGVLTLLVGLQYGCSLLTGYWATTGPLKPSMMILAGVGLLILVTLFLLFWAGFWAIIGRLARKNACFIEHLTIALLTTLLSTALSLSFSILEFSFGMQPYGFMRVLETGSMGLLTIWALSLHLHVATAIDSKKIWIGTSAFVLLLAGGMGLALRVAKTHFAFGRDKFPSVYPASFKWVSSPSVDHHLGYLEGLKKSVDRFAAADKSPR